MKTALLRVYAIILQAAYTFSLQEEYKDVIDPYYSLVGYFNSIRELGGAVRLLQDDIEENIQNQEQISSGQAALSQPQRGNNITHVIV